MVYIFCLINVHQGWWTHLVDIIIFIIIFFFAIYSAYRLKKNNVTELSRHGIEPRMLAIRVTPYRVQSPLFFFLNSIDSIFVEFFI